MKGRAFIDSLRGHILGWPLSREQQDLLADAVEEADGGFRDLIESECVFVESEGAVVEGDGWWDTGRILDGTGGSFEVDVHGCTIGKALSYLERRGLIERKEGEAHLVRFVEA